MIIITMIKLNNYKTLFVVSLLCFGEIKINWEKIEKKKKSHKWYCIVELFKDKISFLSYFKKTTTVDQKYYLHG